jgi:hypothetical protein
VFTTVYEIAYFVQQTRWNWVMLKIGNDKVKKSLWLMDLSDVKHYILSTANVSPLPQGAIFKSRTILSSH